MIKVDGNALYQRYKVHRPKFEEEVHCPLIINIMANPNKGSYSAFCVEVGISDYYFFKWLSENEMFQICYGIAKMIAKENWEEEGRRIAEEVNMPGMSNHKFEHWRMIGWSRYGVAKNARIRLNLNPKDNPNQHYAQLLQQASEGDFTAGEIKQLMEAVNVGLSAHQVFMLQTEIDQLKSDLATMGKNSDVHNSVAAKRITEKD